ncbi:hypothetical protein HELRODRAFT_171243 [Helobdella robusta]|uniref:Uncharacterized protein n=1 Tax=Helobdella robusta TaxID=6412 RepID=T1F3Z7_HELRO|nr:hypothetical protein HELRODRAFT_171243 [Helobdella robusta]ESO05595.1 hypothetical protein HELRODRAFT_171243 [Helobdella robusta]
MSGNKIYFGLESFDSYKLSLPCSSKQETKKFFPGLIHDETFVMDHPSQSNAEAYRKDHKINDTFLVPTNVEKCKRSSNTGNQDGTFVVGTKRETVLPVEKTFLVHKALVPNPMLRDEQPVPHNVLITRSSSRNNLLELTGTLNDPSLDDLSMLCHHGSFIEQKQWKDEDDRASNCNNVQKNKNVPVRNVHKNKGGNRNILLKKKF